MLFWCSNLPITFMCRGYWIPDMFNSCLYFWYFETLVGWFRCCTGCNDAKMDHRQHFPSSCRIMRHPRFALSSFRNGKLTRRFHGIVFHQCRETFRWNSHKNFSKKYKFRWQKSSHSVKKTQKFKVRWWKVTNLWKKITKSDKQVKKKSRTCEKKSQTSGKKTQTSEKSHNKSQTSHKNPQTCKKRQKLVKKLTKSDKLMKKRQKLVKKSHKLVNKNFKKWKICEKKQQTSEKKLQ